MCACVQDILQKSKESFTEEIEQLYGAVSEGSRSIEEHRRVKNFLMEMQEELHRRTHQQTQDLRSELSAERAQRIRVSVHTHSVLRKRNTPVQ